MSEQLDLLVRQHSVRDVISLDRYVDGLVSAAKLVRDRDPKTSVEAASVVEPHLGRIQQAVVEAFRARGPMTARTAEALPELATYGFSTIRKRISELARGRVLEHAGVDRSGRAPCTIYVLSPRFR